MFLKNDFNLKVKNLNTSFLFFFDVIGYGYKSVIETLALGSLQFQGLVPHLYLYSTVFIMQMKKIRPGLAM